MTLDALNSAAAPLHRHVSDVYPVSWTKRRRSRRVFDDDYFAECLIALARSGGATSSSTATVDAKMETKLSSSYNCTLCGEDFSSLRALRRHKVSHPPTADCTSGSHGIHECSICGKIFATGQALGGHMRKHYGGVSSRNGGRVNSSDGGTASTDAASLSDGNGAVDMARNLVLKRPLPPSSNLDLTLKL